MKVKLTILLLIVSLSVFSQGWIAKTPVRIVNTECSYEFVFTDSSTAYVNKTNVCYCVNIGTTVQVGFITDGSTARILSFPYSTLRSPSYASAMVVTDSLNSWLSTQCAGGSGGGGTTTYAGQGLFLRNDSLLITGRLTEPMSILSVGSPVNNPIGGVATVWSDIPTRPTITNACYSDDFSHTTGTEVINFSTINTQIVQTGIFDQNSSLDLDDTKLSFVNDNGIKSTYLIGLPTNDTADQVVLRDMATNELYVSDAGQFVELHATTMVNNAITQLRSDIADTATGLQTRIDTKTNKLITTNRQTASYSLVLSDADKLVEMNVGSANNLTIPPHSSVAFPIGTQILIAQYGAGQTTIVAGSGVTIRSASGKLKLTGQFSGGTAIQIATDEWYLFGDITN